MKIAGIIVNYRTPDLTAQVATALLPELQKVGGFHLYIVDNASGDDSVAKLRVSAEQDGWGDRVSVIASQLNGGYGAGINVGVKAAQERAELPEYYFIINSDAFADPGSLERLVAFMDEQADAGICGGHIRGSDNETQGGAFRFPDLAAEINEAAATGIITKLLVKPQVALPLPSAATAVDWISGACMLIRRRVFDSIGLFDEGFFLYFEEVDFCWRAREAGFRSYCVPEATITHIGSVSTGLADRSRRIPAYWFESRHRYFRKRYGRAYTALCDVSWVAGYLLGETKRRALRRPRTRPPKLLSDFVNNSLRLLSGEDPAPVLEGTNDAPPSGRRADLRTPYELGMLELLEEDFATYDGSFAEPGFWAVAVHRFGARAGAARALPVRAVLGTVYRGCATMVDWTWGINLPRSVELGRRVRIWHNGCMLLNARSIGNDVHLRHDTTFGPVHGTETASDALPIIEDRADIGSGVCVLGGVRIGHDATVGANSVVLKDVPSHATVLGVPARMIPT